MIGTGVCPGRPWRGSWLKVALGKLATERTVPLDAPSMGTEYAFGRARRSQTLVQIRGPYAVRITAHKVAWDGMAAPIPLPKSDRLWRPANTFSKSALPRQLPRFSASAPSLLPSDRADHRHLAAHGHSKHYDRVQRGLDIASHRTLPWPRCALPISRRGIREALVYWRQAHRGVRLVERRRDQTSSEGLPDVRVVSDARVVTAEVRR